MSGERESYHHGDLQEALLVEATAHVRRRGAHSLSLRGVARHVGVDIAAFYRHFRDKDALLVAVARRSFGGLSDRLGDALAASGETPDRVRAFVRAYAAYAAEEPELYRLMVGPWAAGCQLEDTPGARHPSSYALLQGLLAEVAAQGATVAGPVAFASIFAVCRGLASIAVDSGIDIPEVKLEGTLDVLVHGLGLDGAG